MKTIKRLFVRIFPISYERNEWTITKTYLVLFVLMLFYAAAGLGD